MKIRLHFLAALAILTVLSACSNRELLQPRPVSGRSQELCARTHELINDYRGQHGLAALQRHEGLDRLAGTHSRWLLKKRGTSFLHGSNVSHQGFHWRRRVARIEFGMKACGENVAAIQSRSTGIPQHLLLMWKTSPSHHELILRDWTHSGIAIEIDDDGAMFVTQMFGREGEPESTAP